MDVAVRPDRSPAWAAETVCDDGHDNDADSMMDCADKTANRQLCGAAENSDALCSDWVDNDGNGQMDCDDVACFGAGISVCQGSFERKAGVPVRVATPAPATAQAPAQQQPSSAPSEADLRANDNDGERNDLLCSDGIDNDGDGAGLRTTAAG